MGYQYQSEGAPSMEGGTLRSLPSADMVYSRHPDPTFLKRPMPTSLLVANWFHWALAVLQ
jgi:hypothetical protein